LWGPENDAAAVLSAPPCWHAMIHGQIFFEKESLRLRGAISKTIIFSLGQTRYLFNPEVLGDQE
jgi:hypothetical protein